MGEAEVGAGEMVLQGIGMRRLRGPKICSLQAVFSDWMRPTHTRKDSLPYSVYQLKC